MTTYLLAGGGTAGHVNPLLAVADRLRAREPESTILVLGTKEGLESRLVPERGYPLLTIERLPFPRRLSRSALSFPARFRLAVTETRGHIVRNGVDVVVGFGGYASAPAYRAAERLGVPIVIHEANAKAGMANRLGARWTSHVGTAFRSTRLKDATWVGMPLRREIEQLERRTSRGEGIRFFGLDEAKRTLLVTGGSTGARSINAAISEAVAVILGTGWQILHITGAKSDLVDPSIPGYHLLGYCDRMDLAIAAADLAVARSGSGTVSEFAAVGLPAVFVPYPVGNGEQRFNARDAVDAGGALIVADADFGPEWIRGALVPLLGDPARVAEMAVRIETVGTRDGSERMVALIDSALGHVAD